MGRKKKPVKDTLANIIARVAIDGAAAKDARLTESTIDACTKGFIGFVKIDLLQTDHNYEIAYGEWNQREVNDREVARLVQSFRAGVKRIFPDSMLKIPLNIGTEIPPHCVQLVRRFQSIQDLRLKRFETANWPFLDDVLADRVQIVRPVGGQHRHAAIKKFVPMIEKEIEAAAILVNEKDLEVKELKTTVDTEAKMLGDKHKPATNRTSTLKAEIRELEGEIARNKKLIEERGLWLVAIYDESTFNRRNP